jgi:hypothetical protein
MPPQSLLLELEGLRRAEQLLHRGDASAAIGALERLEQAVPAGSLREERDATRTLALCRLGRDPARAFISFAERYPTSVHLDNIRSLCLPSKASSRFALETEPASSSH